MVSNVLVNPGPIQTLASTNPGNPHRHQHCCKPTLVISIWRALAPGLWFDKVWKISFILTVLWNCIGANKAHGFFLSRLLHALLTAKNSPFGEADAVKRCFAPTMRDGYTPIADCTYSILVIFSKPFCIVSLLYSSWGWAWSVIRMTLTQQYRQNDVIVTN